MPDEARGTEGAQSFEARIAHHFICPKCNWACHKTDGLKMNFGSEIDGTYCLRCYAEWLKDHIPRMTQIDPSSLGR